MTKLLSSLFIAVCCFNAHTKESVCYGTTSNGRLEHGVKLPSDGKNFESYSGIANMLGRTYVHSTVRDIVIEAYQQLAQTHPKKVFKYAETGYKNGGQFKPHKTHQNGLSVDFMTPMMNVSGKSVHLPTHAFNKWGYNIELDEKGNWDDLTIDFDALAAHIVALDIAAKAHGVKIWRVIFDPQLQPFLLKTAYGDYLKTEIQFSTKRSWVRHDEHYHIDFSVPCQS